jgi:hypothetical protein
MKLNNQREEQIYAYARKETLKDVEKMIDERLKRIKPAWEIYNPINVLEEIKQSLKALGDK